MCTIVNQSSRPEVFQRKDGSFLTLQPGDSSASVEDAKLVKHYLDGSSMQHVKVYGLK